jgi:hypothetical protein
MTQRQLALLVSSAMIVVVGSALYASAQELEFVPRRAPEQLLGRGFSSASLSAPADHAADWLARHGSAARVRPKACVSCHTESACLRCHGDPEAPSAIHPPGYLGYHSIDARADAASCQSCHVAQTFCRDCHSLTRYRSSGPGRVAPGVRFHPRGWTGAAGRAPHGREARRNLVACTTCHTDTDCVRCHVGINPHPPQWLRTCGAVAARNATSCLRCHRDLERVRLLCGQR